MSLADRLAEEADPRPGMRLDLGPEGGNFEGYTPADGSDVWADFWRLTGLDPSGYRIVDDTIRVSMWQQSKRLDDGSRDVVWLRSYRGSFERITPADLAADEVDRLLSIARRPAAYCPPSREDATRVVVVSDAQVGKVDGLGGTPELLARIGRLLDKLGDAMTLRPCADALVLDPGDLVEGFESTPQQQHTNDLSHPAQLRVARGILTDIVATVASQHEAVTVATCPSNHSAWRRGKGYLGKPGDDYGIDCHLSVADVFARDPRFQHVAWQPMGSEWHGTNLVEARGHLIALAHGHEAKGPDRLIDWWAGQTFGGGPAARADILHTGHYHTARVQQAGTIGGRDRWWLQSPAMDGGSTWFANLTGSANRPGVMTYVLTASGIEDLRIITDPQ